MKIGDIFNAEVKNLPKKQQKTLPKINKLIHNISFIEAAGLLFFSFLPLVVDAAAFIHHTTSSLAMC